MDDRELKPCPFCGGEAELKFYGSGPATRSGVRCVDVMCAGSMRLPLPKENSVAMWNTRTPADRLEEREGWVMVPREPTPEMASAFIEAEDASIMIDPLGAFEDGYTAMLSALPAPPTRTPND